MLSENPHQARSTIAVIVPVYNRPATVLETLASVLAQTERPRRLIVVDDGSQDGTADAVQNWFDRIRLPFVARLIRQENRGVSAARNRAFAEVADCRLVAFLDSDDLWPSDFLQRAGRALTTNSSAVAATADRRFVDSEGTECRFDSSAEIRVNPVQKFIDGDAGIASATLIRADALRQIGGFREDLRSAEDVDLFVRLSMQGAWCYLAGAPVTYQRGVSASRGEAGNLSKFYIDNIRYVARAYDDLLTQYGKFGQMSRAECAKMCSKYWYWAGRELLQAGCPVEARHCFQRSTYWRFWNKSWLALAKTYVRRAA